MPLITTLQQRDKPVTEESFRGLEVTDYNLERILPLWNRSVNFTPQELLKIFERAFEKGFCFKLGLKPSSNKICFMIDGPSARINENYFENIYDFSDPQKTVLIVSDVRLEPRARGRNWGHRFDALFAELNVALGIRRYSFDAMKENGAWVWPYKGYPMKLETDEDRLNAEKISRRVLARLSVLEGLIPDNIYQEAMQLAQFKDPRDICRLANMDFDLSSYIKVGAFDTFYGDLHAPLKNAFFSLEVKDFTEHWTMYSRAKIRIEETQVFCRDRERKFTLGKFSLVGETAECVCDYDDDLQVKEIFGDGSIFHHTKFASHHFARRAHPDQVLRL